MVPSDPTHPIGVDTGGTFTDFVRATPQGLEVGKRLSTPEDPARAVLAGLEDVASGMRPLDVRHGTTVGTNAVLTRSGARVAFLITEGFEDLLHLGDGTRDDLHALHPSRVPPLVPRDACFAVEERVGADGSVVRPLTEKHLRTLRRKVLAFRAEAVVICLLHAAHHPAHERRVAEAFERDMVVVRASHAVCDEPRELPRAETAVLDAFITPRMQAYLDRLEKALPQGALSIMRSDAGRMDAPAAAASAARTLLSGPAAGVSAACDLARRHGLERVLTFDVGGTSTDVAFIEGGEPTLRGTVRLGAHEAWVPGLAIETLGAGGGSIVSLDGAGALRVGPGSAGADPGPACYGRGGPFCLSDAWLLLGRLPAALVRGAVPLDVRAARDAARPLAHAAGCSVRVLCDGVNEVAAAATARALRRVTTREGQPLDEAVLMAFGGGGPTLACSAAAHLGLRRVFVPPHPGAVAALGALTAPWRADARALAPESADPSDVTAVFRRLDAHVRQALRARGRGRIRVWRDVEARYRGQSFEVRLPASGWRRAFHEAHARRYGFARPESPVELVRLHVRGVRGQLDIAAGDATARSAVRTKRPRRTKDGVAILERRRLEPGDRVHGPARLDERTSTTWVAAGWRADVRPGGALELTRHEPRSRRRP